MSRLTALTDEELVREADGLLSELRAGTSVTPPRVALAKAIAIEGLRRAIPAQELSAEFRDLLLSLRNLDRASRTTEATKANVDRKDRQALRAVDLRSQGLSAAQIGVRMANEDDRSGDPYSERQVRKWLRAAREKGDPPT